MFGWESRFEGMNLKEWIWDESVWKVWLFELIER